jgi:hypothetical protein
MSKVWNRSRYIAAFVALWICCNVNAAQVRAWLDRGSMQLGETVTLNIEVSDDAGAAQPDFSALQSDFNLLGTQSSSAMNIVNGQASSKLLWAVGLEPKRAGTLTIPAFTVAGAQTAPLTLTVTPGSALSGKAGDEVFLEVAVDAKSPYVQQQVRVTVKLFYAVNLTDGNLEDPHGEGLAARKLGQDASYTADVDGRRYRVLERHYALTAEKSGTLTLAPIAFRGHALNPNDINSFFNRGHAISAQAPGATLDVRPRPQASGSDAWLPAQSLTLTAEGVDANTQAKVGEPLTLTLHLKAQGLGFEQLPELKLPPIDGADVYPDKEVTQNRDDGAAQFGERTRKFAIVPNRAGTMTIPALAVSWWDTEHDGAASAELRALSLNVAAGSASAAVPTNVQNAANATNILAPAPVAAAPAPNDDARHWRLLTYAALALWLLTVAAWLVWMRAQRRHVAAAASRPTPATAPSANANAARKTFADACAREDMRAAARALLIWARAEGSTARTLGDLGRALDDPQRSVLGDMQRALYGATGAADAKAVASAFRDGLRFAPATAAAPATLLPPLYPFDLRKQA